ncbi:FAD-dependent monooxygenase [Rhizobium sp. Root1220]|uniref:FAD-dependent monooxygenase n=1 Tax=Rhizobium sp. Root1220 TaxID=1736432 RepID=UPI0006F4074A|nr:FAD-dependent monooxygenase [Rhizobium sp. Root1220]KQV68109.1 monooxygenase [Rhizobium sp. Root1220]
MTDVLVVGAGPVGLTMAAELARHGVRCRVIDRLSEPLPYCRAIGVTPRTLEVWDDMGIARAMIDAGLWIEGMRSVVQGHPPGETRHELSDLPYAELGLPQYETERLLADHLGDYGIRVERGVALSGLTQEEEEVVVRLARDGNEEEARFRYVIGCDGAHSAVRRALGIGFPGEAFPVMFALGDVHIDWDLPRGLALRALRLVENGPPDMFIAIPLPEKGRYRVSMLAPAELDSVNGTDHGIQSETRGPQLRHIQAVADSILPDKPQIGDLRWSSTFRISMRLADRYRQGRVFIAGDAAHIHPPTGGQGMNTGIQDAYNLAWKLALVLKGAASDSFLDSYEAERRPVGAEVVERTRAASISYGREKGTKPDRLADTQILVSYRGGAWTRDDGTDFADPIPAPGDRAPDVQGLRRHNVGFPLRLFDILRGTEHVFIAHLPGPDVGEQITRLVAFAESTRSRWAGLCRVVAIVPADAGDVPEYGFAVYRDGDGAFSAAYGDREAGFLIRPDGYVGWRGTAHPASGLMDYWDSVFLRR